MVPLAPLHCPACIADTIGWVSGGSPQAVSRLKASIYSPSLLTSRLDKHNSAQQLPFTVLHSAVDRPIFPSFVARSIPFVFEHNSNQAFSHRNFKPIKMHSISTAGIAALAAALSVIPHVSAHGYISGVMSGGKYYENTSPNWVYSTEKADTPGWYAYDQDNGFVAPDEYTNDNITCHKGATVGGTPIPMAAGDKIDLQWTTWPDSHHGPVITYMAAVDGAADTADKSTLKWFKVAATGLIDGSSSPGTWGSDEMICKFCIATAATHDGR